MGPINTVVVDHPVSHVGQVVATALTFGLALVAFSYMVVLWRRHGIVWQFVVGASGLMTCLMEPLYDHLFGLWFHERGQWHLYTTFGSSQPVWVPAAYLAFYGGAAVFVARTLAIHRDMRTVWTMYGAVVAMSLVAELLYVRVFKVYSYEGPQPFKVLGYPIFLAFTNAMSALVGGMLAGALVRRLTTKASALSLITVIPFAYGGGLFGSGILYLSVRDGSLHTSTLALYLSALTLVAGIALAVRTIGRLLVVDSEPDDAESSSSPARAMASVR